MSVYIIAPEAKHFILPCAVLYRWYCDHIHDVKIVTNVTNAKHYAKFGCVTVIANIFEDLLLSEEDEFVFFKHNTLGAINNFKKVIANFHTKLPQKKARVSFFPDGFGNAMWGENYIEDYSNAQQNSYSVIEVINVFSFGFLHTSTLRQYDARFVTVINYSYLIELIESCDFLADYCNKMLSKISLSTHVVLLPFRPWCTKKFHGGIYDFGDGNVLTDIYCNLIARHIKKDECTILFRGDERFATDTSFVLNQLLSKYPCLEIDTEQYPEWLTLEPLLYFLISRFKDISVINLDSTTFQIVPFLVDNMDFSCHVSGLIGCDELTLAQNNVPDSFKDKKLKGKVRDFKNRYNSFAINNKARLIIEEIDDYFFTVIVD